MAESKKDKKKEDSIQRILYKDTIATKVAKCNAYRIYLKRDTLVNIFLEGRFLELKDENGVVIAYAIALCNDNMDKSEVANSIMKFPFEIFDH